MNQTEPTQAMPGRRRQLFIALGMIAVGVVAFLVYLDLTCGECNGPFGLLDWVIAGLLIGPGFGFLIKWKQAGGSSPRRP